MVDRNRLSPFGIDDLKDKSTILAAGEGIADPLLAATQPAPPVWTEPVTASTGTISVAYSDSLIGKAIDPNGDAIEYGKTGGPNWLTVDTDGALSGTPDTLGTQTFTVTATDGNSTPVPATLTIFVRTTLPPEWDEPVTGNDARIDLPYSDTLVGKATDPDGEIEDDAIEFALLDTGTWLTVGTDGTLGGTPTATDLGTNSFAVTATDPNGTTETTLSIFVFIPSLGDSATISVNFAAGTPNGQIEPDNFAGLAGYANTNWNNVAGESGRESALADSDGTIYPDCTVEWASANTWEDVNADTDATAGIGDAQIARGYCDDGNVDFPGMDWTVTGIPYADYTVVLYLSTDTDGGIYLPFTVNGTSGSTTGAKRRYINPNWDASNTIVFEDLSGDLTIDGPARDTTSRASVAGFQIINVAYIPAGPATVVIAGPVSAGTQMEISWLSENEKLYSVETNANLIIPNWQTFMTDIIGDGGTITVTNTIGPDQTFYRVISE